MNFSSFYIIFFMAYSSSLRVLSLCKFFTRNILPEPPSPSAFWTLINLLGFSSLILSDYFTFFSMSSWSRRQSTITRLCASIIFKHIIGWETCASKSIYCISVCAPFESPFHLTLELSSLLLAKIISRVIVWFCDSSFWCTRIYLLSS